jgi:hypothetical protein
MKPFDGGSSGSPLDITNWWQSLRAQEPRSKRPRFELQARSVRPIWMFGDLSEHPAAECPERKLRRKRLRDHRARLPKRNHWPTIK